VVMQMLREAGCSLSREGVHALLSAVYNITAKKAAYMHNTEPAILTNSADSWSVLDPHIRSYVKELGAPLTLYESVMSVCHIQDGWEFIGALLNDTILKMIVEDPQQEKSSVPQKRVRRATKDMLNQIACAHMNKLAGFDTVKIQYVVDLILAIVAGDSYEVAEVMEHLLHGTVRGQFAGLRALVTMMRSNVNIAHNISVNHTNPKTRALWAPRKKEFETLISTLYGYIIAVKDVKVRDLIVSLCGGGIFLRQESAGPMLLRFSAMVNQENPKESSDLARALHSMLMLLTASLKFEDENEVKDAAKYLLYQIGEAKFIEEVTVSHEKKGRENRSDHSN